MSSVIEMLEAARSIQSNEVLELAFDKQAVREEVKRLQTEVQMYEQGLNADGVHMGVYAAKTKAYKIREGQRNDHVTGRDTGEMYDSTTVTTDESGINIFINTKKTDGDFSEHGYGNIAGLTESNTMELATFAFPYVSEEARSIIGI